MKKRLSILAGCVLASSIVLGACGGGSSSASDSMAMKDSAYSDYAVAAEEAYYSDYDSDDLYEYNEAEESAASVEGEEITDEQIQSNSNRKLIKTVNMSVETKEFDKLISNIQSKINQLGGYAETSNISGNASDSSSKRSAYIVARIPANNLDKFVVSVEDQSNILSKNESAEDVTLSYSDLQARKESLRIEQTRLNALLEQADSLETIIALESRLTEVRYELESYESRLRTMDNQVDYSTVYLNIDEVKEYVPVPIEDPTFGERLSLAVAESCATAWTTIENFIIGFIAFLPILLVLIIIFAVVAGVIFLVVKLVIFIIKKISNGRKKESKAKKTAKVPTDKPVENVAVALDVPPVMEEKIEDVKENGNEQ